MYPEERDPLPLFRALGRLRQEAKIGADKLQVNFRAPGFQGEYAKTIQELGLGDLVKLLPRIPYKEALEEYLSSDALLLMQAANCEHQIPAKTYEYFRLGKPILALTSETGDTAALLREVAGPDPVGTEGRGTGCGDHLDDVRRTGRARRRRRASSSRAQAPP